MAEHHYQPLSTMRYHMGGWIQVGQALGGEVDLQGGDLKIPSL